jgi:hypothetical protein
MAVRNPNVRNRQVVKFFTTGKRFAQSFAVPDYVRGIVKRYDTAKAQAVAIVAEQAVSLATSMVKANYTIPEGELAGKLRTANTPDAFRLFASSLRYPLALFNGQWGGASSSGATAEIVKGQRRTYAHAFIAPGRFRGRTIPLIYTRVGGRVRMKHGRYSGKLREPTKVLRGPSVYQMIIGTDQSGNEKYVPLRQPLTEQLRNQYFAEVNRRYAELAANG